jgi:UDP-N-acetylmuramate dehydrogenase
LPDTRIKKIGQTLKKMYPDQVQLERQLAPFTTYKVGGPALVFVRPKKRDVLQGVLQMCHNERIPIYVLGSGSNVLINDSGLKAVVFRLLDCCVEINHVGETVFVGSGVLVSKLVSYCEKLGFAGIDFMSGIPGTVGGALRMNAGAFVGEIGDRVSKIAAFTIKGDYTEIEGSQAGFGYRRAEKLNHLILLGCWLEMRMGAQAELEKSRKDYLLKRAKRQPLNYSSCGSVFKRPSGFYAGELIEKSGLKGKQIGGAIVSKKHANFIVNNNNASAMDIYNLIITVQKEVYDKFNVWLEPEVKLVGFSKSQMEIGRCPN